MASSDPEKEEAAAATASPTNQPSAAAAEKKKQILEAAAISREKFLRRLEEEQKKQQQPLQQQEEGQQQEGKKTSGELKSPPEDIVKLAQEAGLVAPGTSVQKVQTSGLEENEHKSVAEGGEKDEGKMNEEVKLKKTAAVDKSSMPAESSTVPVFNSTGQEMKGTYLGKSKVISEDKAPNPSSSPPPSNTPTGDQLLLNYLSQYCESSSSPTSTAESDPSNWIQDVDSSSLVYLKSLAGIQDETTICNSFSSNNNNSSLGVYNAQASFNNNMGMGMGMGGPQVNRMDSAYSMYSTNSKSNEDHCYNAFIVHTPAKNEPCKTYECIVPKGVITGQPFNLKAGGVAVRVVCPKDAKVGSKIRFHLPLRLFKEQQQRQEGGKKKNNPPSADQVESQHLDEWTQDEMEMMQQQGGVYPHPSSFGGIQHYESQGGMSMMPSGYDGGSGWQSMYNNNYQGFVAPPLPSMATMAESMTTGAGSCHDSSTTSTAAGEPKEDDESKTIMDGKPKGNEPPSKQSIMTSEDVQSRMLSLIENQQFQMQEMQARLDALGGMMAGMEQDVRFVRSTNNHQPYSNNRYNQPNGQGYGGGVGGGGGAPVQGYKLFGGLFGGGPRLSQHQPPPMGQERYVGDANYQQPPPPVGYNNLPVIPTQPPQQQQSVFTDPFAQQAQSEQQQEEQQSRQPPAPAPAMDAPNPLQQGAAANNINIAQQQQVPAHERAVEIPMNQGIFFPLFVMLFQFLFSIPGQVRSLLLSTGPGRVYVHLRDEAIDRRAFANVDLSSIIKLLVMLLIFTGRVGRNENNGGRPRRNGVVNQEAENGMLAPLLAYAASLLQRVVDYWNGHRVHTLVLAAIVAFLIQVGLMSFLYEVLWVERGELWNVWLGRENEEEDEGEDDLANDADGQGGNIGDAAQEGGDNPAAVGRRQNRVANARPAPPPGGAAAQAANPHGGLIRRGPNNGGFFHDIQCLILSFLLSLIPNWRPEEAAQEPQVTPEDDQQHQQQQQETIEGADQVGEQAGQQPDGAQDAGGADEQPAQEGEEGNNEDAAD